MGPQVSGRDSPCELSALGAVDLDGRGDEPLAAPLAIAGVRTASVEVVATSTLAAYVSFNDLGVFIFAGLVTLVPLLGLRWRQYPFGVATGFGLYATVSLLTTTAFSDFGTRFTFLWGVTSLVAYSLTVIIWIWFFSAPQKSGIPTPEVSALSPGDLKKYKDALRRMR